MAFVNLSLLLGGAFMAIPIVVHLTMRRKPQRQIFPALRFLKERRESNRQKLELRHWLLLSLRCGLVGILAMALARPSVDAAAFGHSMLIGSAIAALLFVGSVLVISLRQKRGRLLVSSLGGICALLTLLLIVLLVPAFGEQTRRTLGSKRDPVAAALVVDTSLRMGYVFENKTRLDSAREMALWLLDQLPAGSQIAVIESRPGPAVFSVDLSAARQAVERLRLSALSEPLAVAAIRGVELLESNPLDRKELYLFGDLTKSAWPSESADQVKQAVSERPNLTCYVVDRGVDDPTNTSLGDLLLSAERMVVQNELSITTHVAHVGEPTSQVIELLLEEQDTERPVIVDGEVLLPAAVPRDHAAVELRDNDSQQISFKLQGLPLGIHHGTVRLRGADSLTADNVRNFTVDVREAWQILVAAPANVSPSLFVEAIAPYAFRQAGKAEFKCRAIQQADLATADLSQFAAVCLLDPEPVADAAGQALADYVAVGGSLALFLGHNAQPPERFNRPRMDELIGAQLADRWRAGDRDLFLAPTRFDHPVLASFRSQASRVPWRDSPIFRHWMLDSIADPVTVVASFTNGKPALLENRLGAGRVLTLTTPVTDPLLPRGRATWNELPTSENAWPYLILVNEIMHYLVNRDDSRLNFRPGEFVALSNDPERDPPRYRLFVPGKDTFEVTAQGNTVAVRSTEQPGIYRLKGRRQRSIVRGFSVNSPASSFDLTRLERASLTDFFGAEKYYYARERSEIVSRVGQARTGREFYPYLLVALVLVVGLEHLLANRFYRAVA